MYDVIDITGPTVVYVPNALDASSRKVFRGQRGLSLRELSPKTSQPTICCYNGNFVLPEDWDWVPSDSDHVVFMLLPKGGGDTNASMQVFAVVLIVVGYIVPGAQALIYVGAGMLAASLLPTPQYSPLPSTTALSPSPTYSVGLAGNSARLGGSIPVPYGRHILMPDFASQPYVEYEGDDQFYFAILCLGQVGTPVIESVMIDDTELSHFAEVSTEYVGPGNLSAFTLVDPAVVTAPEVANQDLEYGTYVGPFACSGPGLKAKFIAIDIACPKGLYYADETGNLDPLSVTWLVEARAITDSGTVAGDWFLLGSESLTDNTSQPIRRSYKYTVALGRYEVRVQRVTARNDNARAGNDLQWIGMRAYLNQDAPNEPSATFLALKIRATSQLSSLSQRRISVIVQRKLPTWNPSTGWSAPVLTRSIAWAIADVLRNEDYGGRIPDINIDLPTLHELEQIWVDRGDEFNGVFDKRSTVWAAITSIARAGRARPIMRGNVFTFVRDGLQELPTAMFNMRNIQRGSFSINYNLLTDDESDGLELEYFDETIWATAYILVKIESDNTFHVVAPGDDEPRSPTKVTLFGVTKTAQATREALYMVAEAVYRRAGITITTELEGHLPCYGDLIAVAHDLAGWGVSGEADDWDPADLIMTCTEEPKWSVGNHYAILSGPQGDVYGPYRVVAGPGPNTMQFIEAPDPAADIYTGTERERTRFSMGPSSTYSKMCKVVAITPQQNTIEIRALIEDNRVHSADGGGGGGGGGGERLARYAPDGTPVYDSASDTEQSSYGFFTRTDGKIGVNLDEGYTYVAS